MTCVLDALGECRDDDLWRLINIGSAIIDEELGPKLDYLPNRGESSLSMCPSVFSLNARRERNRRENAFDIL